MFSIVIFENAQRAASYRASTIKHFALGTLSLLPEPQKRPDEESLYDKLVTYLEKKQKQPIQVEIPGKWDRNVPSDASPDEISDVIKRDFFSHTASVNDVADFNPASSPSPAPSNKPLSASAFLDEGSASAPSTAEPWERNYTVDPTPPSPTPSKYADLLAAAEFDQSVKPGDLKKVVLFDVGVEEIPHFARDAERGIFAFHGRLRNQLPRAIQDVVLKGSVYNAAGELIEVKKFRLYKGPFEPQAPASFSGIVDIHHLPKDYKYRVELIEAHYAR